MSDLFVNISNIEGESSDAGHRGWIEALTYSGAVFQKPSTAPSSIGGECADQADFKPFAFSNQVDRASPLLAQACAAGTHIDTIRLEIWRSGSNKDRYIWDKGKKVRIFGVPVADDTMGEFHLQGLAREFGMNGSVKKTIFCNNSLSVRI
jgi:type VI secretion system Hcp family effector